MDSVKNWNFRYVGTKDEASSDISTRIAHSLLEKSQMSPDDLDLILVGTVTLTTLPSQQLWFKKISKQIMMGI